MASPEDSPRKRPPATNLVDSVTTAVIEAVADHAGVDPTELPPLFEAVDTDALDAIFGSLPGGPPRREGEVAFPYAGYRIRVTAERAVEVTPQSSGG